MGTFPSFRTLIQYLRIAASVCRIKGRQRSIWPKWLVAEEDGWWKEHTQSWSVCNRDSRSLNTEVGSSREMSTLVKRRAFNTKNSSFSRRRDDNLRDNCNSMINISSALASMAILSSMKKSAEKTNLWGTMLLLWLLKFWLWCLLVLLKLVLRPTLFCDNEWSWDLCSIYKKGTLVKLIKPDEITYL